MVNSVQHRDKEDTGEAKKANLAKRVDAGRM
jgi:hypothetical protein